MRLSKRSLGTVALGAAVALLLAGCSSSDDPKNDGTDAVEVIKYGSWQPGPPAVSNMWTHFLEENPEIQAKHGIEFSDEAYTNLQTLYTDLGQGRVQGVSAGPSSMAALASQGAPLRIAGLSARSTASILSTGKEWNAESLKGSRLVAPTGTASWGEIEGLIESNLGLKAGTDYELVTSADLGGAVTQLAAGTADYAMSWGEYIPNALAKFPNVKVAADPQTIQGKGDPFWQFSITVHKSVSEQGGKALVEAAKEVVAWMKENPDKVDEWAVSQGQPPGIAKSMLVEGYQTFDMQVLNDELESELTADFEVLIANGKQESLPPASFFGH